MGQFKDEILLKKVALRIKELRESKDITQEVFYNDTDIHIGRIELGNQNISISTLSQICKYLDVTLEDFLKDI
jgi:transcriptional regulator with XRE-family HTH domain